MIHHDNLKPCNDRVVPTNLKRLRQRLINKLPLDGQFDEQSTAEFWDLVDPEIDNSSEIIDNHNDTTEVQSNDNVVNPGNDEPDIHTLTRKSVRTRRRPNHLNDYECDLE